MSRIRAFQVRDSSGDVWTYSNTTERFHVFTESDGGYRSIKELTPGRLFVEHSPLQVVFNEGGNPPTTEFRHGDFVKPKEKVYQVIQDFGDGTFTATDLQTGDVSHFVSELFEKSTPPNPSPGEVWVLQKPFGGSGEGDAYLVHGYDDGEILLKGSEEVLRVDPRVLYVSDEWRRIH